MDNLIRFSNPHWLFWDCGRQTLFTDIIAGAMVGTLVGYLSFDALHDKYVGTKNNKPKYFPKFSCSPNNINLTLKL